MKASHNLVNVSCSFDEDNLVPNAGLLAPAMLAQQLGVAQLVDRFVSLPGSAGANAGAKALTVIGSALAGGDCIDDVDVLRAGAADELFDQVRAPSTVGTWLRTFTWGTARQLDRVSRELLARVWAAGLGPADLDADVTIDVDSTICETYGLAKQGATKFTYTHVRGYHPLVASLKETGELLHARLRAGNATSGRGAESFVAETISRVRAAGATGRLTVRADSGFYLRGFVRACRRADARFSVTVRKNAAVTRAIAGIADDAWTPIPYWIDGGADVAETAYTCFAGTKDAVDVRLLVRRVRPTPGSQLALDVVFDYHAIVTDRDGDLLELEADHRQHAVVEQTIADLKHHAGLAHLPSGKFAANAAWLALIGIAYNLARWTARAAGDGWQRITTKTLRRIVIAMPARLIHGARRLRLRVPTRWPWADVVHAILARLRAIPAPG